MSHRHGNTRSTSRLGRNDRATLLRIVSTMHHRSVMVITATFDAGSGDAARFTARPTCSPGCSRRCGQSRRDYLVAVLSVSVNSWVRQASTS
jgi:hypothetical protein